MDRRKLIMGGAALSVLALGCAGRRARQGDVATPSEATMEPVYTAAPSSVTFVGGTRGPWTTERLTAVRGETLPTVERLAVHAAAAGDDVAGAWSLRGVAGHVRYVERPEKSRLDAISPPLARPDATKAALLPIKKSAAWWGLAQDERREIFEARSHHIADSMKYLPRIARRLYHSRDLGEPFDFLTWFEFAPEHAAAFDDLLGMLRSREEWTYVEREVEIRLTR